MFKTRKTPELYYNTVPHNQHHPLLIVGHCLENLNYYLHCFEADLRLHDYAATMRRTKRKYHPFRDWQFVAARDGAVSIYNFGWALRGLCESTNRCGNLVAELDTKAFRTARDRFETLFPNAKAVRDAVAHASEKARNPPEHKSHGFTGSYRRHGLRLKKVRHYVISDHLYRRTYCVTWKHKIEAYKINTQSLRYLESIRDAVFDVFDDTFGRMNRGRLT